MLGINQDEVVAALTGEEGAEEEATEGADAAAAEKVAADPEVSTK